MSRNLAGTQAVRGALPVLLLSLALYYQGILYVAEHWTTRDLPDVGLFLALCTGLALLDIPHLFTAFRVFWRPGIRGWLAFLAWGAFSLLWSTNAPYGAIKLATLLIVGVLPGSLSVHRGGLSGESRWWPLFAGGMLFAAVVVSVGEVRDSRLSFEGGNPIWIARSCLVAASIAIWAPQVPLLMRVVVAAICVATAVLTGSRGPLLSFVVAPVAAASVTIVRRGMRFRSRSLRKLLLLGGVGAALAFAFFSSEPSSPNGPVTRLLTIFAPADSLSQDEAVAGRMALQEIAWTNFTEQPFFGVGAGGNAPLGVIAYPHNIFLETASEMGLVGLAILCWLVGRSVWRARGDRLLLLLLIQTLIYSFLSGDLGSNELLVIFICLSGCAQSVPSHERASADSSAFRTSLIGPTPT